MKADKCENHFRDRIKRNLKIIYEYCEKEERMKRGKEWREGGKNSRSKERQRRKKFKNLS